MAYSTEVITENQCHGLRERFAGETLFSARADIGGVVVELNTSDRDDADAWRDNFYAASDRARPHIRLYCVSDADVEGPVLRYEPHSGTGFLYNISYYGWIKSIALGMTGCLLESAHDVYSVHGAAVDVDGRAVAIIAPPKTGKTTQSWGLLREPNASLISDDWFFVRFGNGRPVVGGSEKNCYVDADIGDVWEEYRPLVRNVKFDENGRGIANIRWVNGDSAVRESSRLGAVVMLERDPSDPDVCRRFPADEAMEYLLRMDFCNPHQIVRDPFRIRLRGAFFKRMLDSCDVYLVNTVGTPRETQGAIRRLVGLE